MDPTPEQLRGARSRGPESDERGAASEGLKPQGGGGGTRHGEIKPRYASIPVLSTALSKDVEGSLGAELLPSVMR